MLFVRRLRSKLVTNRISKAAVQAQNHMTVKTRKAVDLVLTIPRQMEVTVRAAQVQAIMVI